ncbi:Smr/MutS family protein [bacterium]|nr:Smr/MutS family protein [bacterium]
MKQLTDADIEQMACGEFRPDMRAVNKSVRANLRLGQLIPPPTAPVPKCTRLDLHTLTEEQAWNAIMDVVTSGARRAIIITGASGILKIKFQQWVRESVLSSYILSWKPLNNGSFEIFIRNRCSQRV